MKIRGGWRTRSCAGQGVQDGFSKTLLPGASVYALSLALPFCEVTIGVLLILGLLCLS